MARSDLYCVPPSPPVVLADRSSHGIEVTLLWAEDTNTVAVHVRDDLTSEEFELSIEPGVNALDVFNHPYAYAAWRGVDLQSTALGDVELEFVELQEAA